uniref:DDE Tnp4 domain-containing protein n=1 Tax=Sinocyclocheilus rhinocerous TaxID=307959 RepID=A0A673NED2_9TELE
MCILAATLPLLLLFVLKSRLNIILFLLLIRKQRVCDVLCHAARIYQAITMPLPDPITRRLWMRVRSKDWWDNVGLHHFTDEEWKENFRMTQQSFMALCSVVEWYMAPDEVTVRAPIPMRVTMELYKLGSCAEYHVISNQFGVHKSTVKKFVYMFCKVPNEEEALEIARNFQEMHNIPQIMGLIDGTHIPIFPLSDGYKDFLNRKGWPSYALQAFVDHKSCFWSISCKMPGSAHDANVLRQSDLFQRSHLLPKGVKNIEGQDIRLLIESFNAYLSSLRVGVENTFGILKSRWKVLLKRSDFHFSFTPTVIANCCALHNFCQTEKDNANSRWLEEACDLNVLYLQPSQPVNTGYNASGNNARIALTTYMSTHFPLLTGHFY